MAIEQDFEFYRTEDIVLELQVLDPISQLPMDITGWTLAFNVRKGPNESDVLITKSTTSGINLVAPGTGRADIEISRENTIDLKPREYAYDIHRTNTGNETMLTTGKMLLLPSVTR